MLNKYALSINVDPSLIIFADFLRLFRKIELSRITSIHEQGSRIFMIAQKSY